MPHVHIHGSAWCAVEKAPTGSQLLIMFCFFFFFGIYMKIMGIKLNFEAKSVLESRNLDFNCLRKAGKENFD